MPLIYSYAAATRLPKCSPDCTLDRRSPPIWQGHVYRLRNGVGAPRGTLGLHPAPRPKSGPRHFAELFETGGQLLSRPLVTLLLENLYDLHVEPGRPLVDQCGVALARVLEVWDRPTGGTFVWLDMNASDVTLEQLGGAGL
ncbi:MAG: hypothetical protein LBV60_09010 [Streptomyces sp.]|jgi:diaminopimelate decarboxylase|nr:hypothetical protein [Streptomyces sp.]